jgi:hypothetical protein
MTGRAREFGNPPVEEPVAAKEATSDPASAADPGPPLPTTTMATDTLLPQHHEHFTMKPTTSRAWDSEALAHPGPADAAPPWGGSPPMVDSGTRQRGATLPRATVEMMSDPSLGVTEGLSSEGGRRGGRHVRSPGRHWDGGGILSSRAGQLVSGGPCSECGATKSTLFRKSAEGAPLCNACGLRYSRNLAKQTARQQSTTAERQRQSYFGGEVVSTGGTEVPCTARQKTAHKAGTSPKKTRRRLPPDEQRWCRQCGATTSPQWRYVDNRLACNACALRTQRRQERREGKEVRYLLSCQRLSGLKWWSMRSAWQPWPRCCDCRTRLLLLLRFVNAVWFVLSQCSSVYMSVILCFLLRPSMCRAVAAEGGILAPAMAELVAVHGVAGDMNQGWQAI